MQSRKYDKKNNPVYTTTDNQVEFSISKKASVGGLKRCNVSFNFGLAHAEQNQEVMNAIAAASTPAVDEVVIPRPVAFKK